MTHEWPYTTPSGHTYEEPTTYRDLRQRGNDLGQGTIEGWDPAELPPQPTWAMLGIALREGITSGTVRCCRSGWVDGVAVPPDVAPLGGLEVGVQFDGDPSPAAPDGCARGRHVDGRGAVAWGEYEPAIRRWERVLRRSAPDPVDERGRLAPPFVEWMMGYPAGWVDGLKRTAALRCLGNAVVPSQGVSALSLLLDAWDARV